MVQMDRLDFSDNFSYINYFIWSYRLISMNFRSFSYFLEFSDISKIEIIQKRVYCVSTASCLRQQVSSAN